MVAGILIDDNKLNQFKTGVQTNVHLLDGSHVVEKPKPNNVPQETNLLDMSNSNDGSGQKKQDPIDMMKELGEVLNQGVQN
jgi:hypothetical protein